MTIETGTVNEQEAFAPMRELGQSLLLIGLLLAPIGVTLGLALAAVRVLAG